MIKAKKQHAEKLMVSDQHLPDTLVLLVG